MKQFLSDDLYLAIDGGGTSCKARLYDFSGNVLAEGKSGPANARLGVDRVYKEILAATNQCFVTANLAPEIIKKTHVCFGLAGLELKRDQDKFDALETDFKSVLLEGDGVTACIGALGGEDGAIIITGTGTAATAMHNGTIYNVGGWGFEVSDDGSGAILGRHAIRHSLKSAEKLAAQTPLTMYIMNYFNNDIAKMVEWAETAEPSDYASFVAKIFDYAEQGDEAAAHLLGIHIKSLVQLIDGIMACGTTQFTLLGGLAERSAIMLPERLKNKYITCKNDALYGGFLRITRLLKGSRISVPQKFAM